jgi:hypothetical protein
MFEEMRKSGAALPLASRPHVIPDIHTDDRHAVILVKNHMESVGQVELCVGKLKRRCVGRQ